MKISGHIATLRKARHASASLGRIMFGVLLVVLLTTTHSEAREVRVGIYENQPKVFTDNNGVASGIFVDILNTIASKEDWHITYVPCEWKACLKQLEYGSIELMPDVAHSTVRDSVFDFHDTPALHSWSQIYRRLDQKLESTFELADKRIAVLQGSIQEQEFNTLIHDFGLKVDVIPAPTIEAVFDLAQTGKADAAIASHYYGRAHAVEHDLEETPIVFQPMHLYFATKKGRNADLLRALETHLALWQQDKDSVYFDILKKWNKQESAYFISPMVKEVLLFLILLLILSGIFSLVLRERLKTKTAHLLTARNDLKSTLDALPDLLFEIDLNGRYLAYHSPSSDLLAAAPELFLGKTMRDVFPPEIADIGYAMLSEVHETGRSHGKLIELQLPDGKHWFELSASRKVVEAGQLPRFIVLSHDITQLKVAELKLARLTRLYAALSECNQAIVRCNNESELFPQICSDVVKFGGMKFAWIGLLDEKSQLVKPVASFGTGIEYLEGLVISVDASGPKGRGPTGTAVRENRPYWCQDFQNAAETSAWHERGALFGWRASASLPLLCKGVVVGAFTLYADHINAFDEAAQNLLVEMAMDISYALNRFSSEEERRQTEINLSESEHRYRTAFKTSPDAVNINRISDGVYLDANDGFTRNTGWTKEYVLGKTSTELGIWHDPADRERLVAALKRDGRCSNLEADFNCKDGRILRGLMSAEVISLKGESCILSITRDITALKQSAALLALQAQRAEALLALPNLAEGMDEREFMSHGLEIAEQLTDSCISFVHLVHDDQVTIELESCSRTTKAKYCHAFSDVHYSIDQAGVWADALRQRKPIVINDYATAAEKRGLPEGHAHLERLVSVPVIEGGLVRMMLGMGNKSHNYTDLDVETLQLVANSIWRIGQQRRAEAALRFSEEKYRVLTEGINDVIWTLDVESLHFTYVSPSVIKLRGYTPEEIMAEPVDAALTPEESGNVRELIRMRARMVFEINSLEPNSYVEEIAQPCKNGSFVWTEVVTNYVLNPNTHKVEVRGVTRNINERKRLQDSLQKLSLAVEQSPNSIVITDLDARIEYANETFTKVTGYTLEEVVGQNPRMLQSGRTSKEVYADMWAHLVRGEVWRGELINRRKDGSEYIESALISPVRQEDGRIINYLAIKENITDKRRDAERILQLANFDLLTGLPNRALLNERFSYAFSLAQRSRENLAVMFLDLDHFKNINDTLGHSIGDKFLIEVAQRLKATLRDEDTVSRLGGDEFILVFPGTNSDGAAIVASKLLEVVSKPYQIDEHELVGTPSIGIAIYPNDGANFEDLLKNADAAMYRVKQESRNNYRFFTAEMQSHSERNLQLVNAMRHALERKEFHLLYQPQVTLSDGHIIGAEALLRWQHPELGLISPAEFIPIAEDSGQIITIGEWVLREAVSQMKAWMESGLPPMVVAVNLSAIQFRQPNLPELVTRILAEAQLPAEYLELELTEAVAMDDPQVAVNIMDDLFARGIRMSIDDFGTGYSSLSYLKRFKVYKLKIDQSFVRDISDDPEDKAIVTAIINLASSLGMHTIAEGVETASQLAFLRLQGCDEVQGYYFSKPLPSVQFEEFVRKQK